MPAQILKSQYELLKGSRHVLFSYCDTFNPTDLTTLLENFGHGSIRNLLVHNANVYIHWMQNFALSKTIPYINDETVNSMADVRHMYQQTDMYVDEFIATFADK